MIRYIEKGAGLHEAIADAGHWLAQVDGVWQSSDDAAVQAIIDAYVEPAKAMPDLTRPQFAYLLGLGLGDVWAGLEAQLREVDRERYARLAAERARETFRFEATLFWIDQFRDYIPEGVDLSREALAEVWEKAAALDNPVVD